MRMVRTFLIALTVLLLAAPQNIMACATCYGASDSPLSQGMNWGIVALLGFILSVLAGVTSFFVYIVRRANANPLLPSEPAVTDSKP